MPSRASVRSVLALTAALLVAFAARDATAEVKKGDRSPDFVQVVDGAGKKVSLKSYRDKVVVITFGASWCVPCKKELPALEKLARRYEKRGVVFFAVNIDNEIATGKQFMKKAGLRAVRALYDPRKSTVESYNPPKMPTTFVIRRGVVRHLHAGFASGDESAIARAIDAEL